MHSPSTPERFQAAILAHNCPYDNVRSRLTSKGARSSVTLAKAASTTTQHLQCVSVTEDGVVHTQFSTFERTSGTQVDSFSRRSWVQLQLLRARPMAAMASAVRGRSVVYHKEGIDPCISHAVYCTAAHHCIGVYQRRRRPWGRAGPQAGCTTAPAKLASGKPPSWTKGQAADAHHHGGNCAWPGLALCCWSILGFDKCIILSYNLYKLVIPTGRGQCSDASVG
jgi:hypothetical protein